MPFGIPPSELSIEPIVEALTASNGDLMVVVSALTKHLGETLTDSEALTGTVVTTVRRSLSSRAAANDRDLTESIGSLGADLSSGVVETETLLADLSRAIDGALGKDYPPSSPDNAPLSLPQIDEPPDMSPAAPPPDDRPNPWTVERDTINQEGEAVEILTARLGQPELPNEEEYVVPPPSESVRRILESAPGYAGVPAALEHGLPFPGSVEFCEIVPVIVKFLEGVADTIIAFLADIDSVDKIVKWLEGDRPKAGGNPFYRAFVDAVYDTLLWVIRTSRPVIETVFAAIKVAWHWYGVLCQRYSPSAIAGLALLDSLLQALKKFRLGNDVVVWATADFGLHMSVFERVRALLENYFAPMAIPAAEEATHAWLRGLISVDIRNCIWLLHGLNPDVYEVYAYARGERLSSREAVQYARRQGDGIAEQDAALRRTGWVDESQRAAMLEMYDELPSITDHLTWLRKNVFDDQYVADYGLMDGFEEKFWAKFGRDLSARGMRKEYAALHYAAHWIQPAPAQMREFLYRLRPEVVGPDDAFELDDYKRIMAEQDYSPLAREWFAATAYRVPALGYLRDMHRLGVINDEALAGYHRDLGYSEADSLRFVGVDRVQRVRHLATAAHGWTPAALASTFAGGQTDRDTVVREMTALGYTAAHAETLMRRAVAELRSTVVRRARSRLLTSTITQLRQSIEVGIIGEREASAALQAAGWPRTQSDGIAKLEFAGASVKRIKQAVAGLRAAYLRGEVGRDAAAAALGSVGITGDAVANYLATWTLQLTPRRKQRSAKETVESLAQGDITTGDAIARLLNLGYSDADSRLYMADAQRRLAALDTARRAAQVRQGKEAQLVLEKVQKEADRQKSLAVKELQRQAPPGKLAKWLRLGIIGRDIYRARMRVYGYSEESIDDHEREACAAKGAVCADAATVPSANGGGAGGADTIRH